MIRLSLSLFKNYSSGRIYNGMRLKIKKMEVKELKQFIINWMRAEGLNKRIVVW